MGWGSGQGKSKFGPCEWCRVVWTFFLEISLICYRGILALNWPIGINPNNIISSNKAIKEHRMS